jgi:hypothetical protein
VPLINPSFRVTDVVRQSTLVDDALLRERALALPSGFPAIVGLVLAAVGLYGVLSSRSFNAHETLESAWRWVRTRRGCGDS